MKKTKSGKPLKAKAKTTCSNAKSARHKNSRFDGLMRLMTRETDKSVQFEISAEQGSKVYVVGTFNNWNPTTHPLQNEEDGVFKATIRLPIGTHEYKFVVNGVWQCDGKCPLWAPNGHGTLNSVLKV